MRNLKHRFEESFMSIPVQAFVEIDGERIYRRTFLELDPDDISYLQPIMNQKQEVKETLIALKTGNCFMADVPPDGIKDLWEQFHNQEGAET